MRKSIRGLLCGVMALTMMMPTGIVSNIPVREVYAAEYVNEYEGKIGDDVTYAYDTRTKTLTVSGKGEMWDGMNLPNEVLYAKNIVIEEGVTSIGSNIFYNMEDVDSLKIANTVTAINSNALFCSSGELEVLEIPASVTRIESDAINGVVNKIVVKGDMKNYDYGAIEVYNTEEIVLHGSADDLGKFMAGEGYADNNTIITIAEGNKKCTVNNGCITSADGKEVYYYISNASKVKLADTVEKIHAAAFYNKNIKQVTLGKNVKEIGDRAFQNTNLNKVKFSKKLKKVGEYAFYNTAVKSAEFSSKVIIGNNAFGSNAVIRNKSGIKKASTSINSATVSSNKLNVKYSKVADASGYEIKVKAGKKTFKYTTTSTSFKKTLDKKIKDYYEAVEYEYEDDSSVAITVTVRPYKVVKGKKIYGKNSVKTVLEF